MTRLGPSLLALLLTIAVTACSGGGKGGRGGAGTVSLSGTWDLAITTTASTCADNVGAISSKAITIAQNGATATISGDLGNLTGTIDGRTMRVTGSGVEITVVVESGDRSLTGDGALANDADGCVDNVTIVGVKEGGGGDAADFSGSWAVDRTITQSTCDDRAGRGQRGVVEIEQDGDQVTIRDLVGDRDLSGTVTGQILRVRGGGVELTITLTADGRAFSGSGTIDVADGGRACTDTVRLTGARAGDGEPLTFDGTWSLTETRSSRSTNPTCQTLDGSQTRTLFITQTGSVAAIRVDDQQVTGTVTDDRLRFSVVLNTNLLGGGIAQTTYDVNLQLSQDGRTVRGDGTFTARITTPQITLLCTGTAVYEGRKIGGAALPPLGHWQLAEVPLRGSDRVELQPSTPRSIEVRSERDGLGVAGFGPIVPAVYDDAARQLAFEVRTRHGTVEIVEWFALVFETDGDPDGGPATLIGLSEWTVTDGDALLAAGASTWTGDRVPTGAARGR